MKLTSASALLLLLTACGGEGEAREIDAEGPGLSGSMPTSGGEQVRDDSGFELAVRLPDGNFIDVGDLRGRVVLLYIFATFDGISQMGLQPVTEIVELYPSVAVIGVAAQPRARMLVDAYVHALAPPFPVGYDPEDLLIEGRTTLGELEAIPTIAILDRQGRVRARRVGFVERPELEAMLDAAGFSRD